MQRLNMNTSIQQVSYSKMVTQLNPNQAFALNAILVGRVTSIGAHGSMSAYSGERDRSFRLNVTAAHQMVLRG